jgi:hypothetical protein
MKNKILWSDETTIKPFDLNAKHHVCRKSGPIIMVKHGGGSIMQWMFFRDWETSQDRGKD